MTVLKLLGLTLHWKLDSRASPGYAMGMRYPRTLDRFKGKMGRKSVAYDA